MQSYRMLQDRVESNPDLWYVEAEYETPLNEARRRLSKLVNCDDRDLVFIQVRKLFIRRYGSHSAECYTWC